MYMGFFEGEETAFAGAVSRLVYCNPFLPERIAGERDALGEDFVPSTAVWSVRAGGTTPNPNVNALGERTRALADRLHRRLTLRTRLSSEEKSLYRDLVLYLLYSRYEDDYKAIIEKKGADRRVSFYSKFVRDAQHYLGHPAVGPPTSSELAHFFALFFQIRRAFHHTFSHIVGTSHPTAGLRAAIWQSIFTHDFKRYRRALYERMGDVTTLVTGPSGTGKELVARAIGLSRYIPFDSQKRSFVAESEESFHALNLSALSPTLIESELFGHRKGAVHRSAAGPRRWLEVCPASWDCLPR